MVLNAEDGLYQETEDFRLKKNCVLLSGYAKLPLNTTAEAIYKTIVIAAEVDMTQHCIVKVECSLVTSLARDFVAQLMEGYDLTQGIEPLVKQFEEKYWGSARKAIIVALRMMYTRYKEIPGKTT